MKSYVDIKSERPRKRTLEVRLDGVAVGYATFTYDSLKEVVQVDVQCDGAMDGVVCEPHM